MAWPQPSNTVVLWGMLSRLEFRTFKSGNGRFATFVVSTRTRMPDKEWVFEYHPCVPFGKTVERLEEYFEEGNHVGVMGALQTRRREGREGKVFYDTNVNVVDLAYLPKGTTPSEAELAPPEATPRAASERDEDLPF